MLAILVVSAVISIAVPKVVIDFDRLIGAIESVENGDWSKAGGRACWTETEWKRYSVLPYSAAKVPAHSRAAMLNALNAYCRRLIEAGETPTFWKLATIWHLGWDGMHRTRRTKDDFGERCANLAMGG